MCLLCVCVRPGANAIVKVFMDLLSNHVLVLYYDSQFMSVALLRNIKGSLHSGWWEKGKC